MNTPNERLPSEVDVTAVKRMLDAGDDFVLVDCREDEEFAIAKIDGAVLFPLSRVEDSMGDLMKLRDRHVVVHCHHGVRSLRLTNWLTENGFSRVQSMAGGIDQWSLEIDANVPRY